MINFILDKQREMRDMQENNFRNKPLFFKRTSCSSLMTPSTWMDLTIILIDV